MITYDKMQIIWNKQYYRNIFNSDILDKKY